MTNVQFVNCTKHMRWLLTAATARHEIPHQRTAEGVVRDFGSAAHGTGREDLAHGASFEAGFARSAIAEVKRQNYIAIASLTILAIAIAIIVFAAHQRTTARERELEELIHKGEKL